jgi:ComEC/Rec2-related protein
MTNVAALPALALLVGAAAGVYVPLPLVAFVACAVVGWLALTLALMAPVVGGVREWTTHLASIASLAGFFGSGAALAADATREALTPAILADTHAMRVEVAGASGAVPVVLSGVIRTDASATDFGAMFTLATDAIRVDGVERETAGTVRIAVGGTSAARHRAEWRAGRRVRVTATLAAPLPYLNVGTPNQETRLALAGVRLFGSVKSAAQIDLLAHGRWWDEAAASARAFVRRAVADHVHSVDSRKTSSHDKQSAAVDTTATATDAAAAVSAKAFVRRAVAVHERIVGSQKTLSYDKQSAAVDTSATATDVAAAAATATGDVPAGTSAAIAAAILIGDRAGLDQDVEERLQRAGTFHVIAISGGNIAILTALILGLLRLFGLPPRTCAWLTIAAVATYAFIVGSGASVARASLAAIVYLFARAIDHRTPSLNVLAVVVAIMLVWAPLEIVDAGFWLTCLATLAIMLLAERLAERAAVTLRRLAAFVGPAPEITGTVPAAPEVVGDRGTIAPAALQQRTRARGRGRLHEHTAAWLMSRAAESTIGLLAATVAAEAVLLPVTAYAFSQVSIAGLALNFLAIPLMTVVQVAGIASVLCAGVPAFSPLADVAGAIVDLAARGIVSSSLIVDAAPWSAPRVAPPPLWLLFACQASFCVTWFSRPPPWRRRIAACVWLACIGLVVWALPLPSFALHAIGSDECQMTDSDFGLDGGRATGGAANGDAHRSLRVTFLDVAQGDATLIRFPDGHAWLVDTGGALGRFDIGTRIVSPALWALGLRSLSTLVLTHADRDHIGGAHAMLRDFRPAEVWEGVPVDGHAEMTRLRGQAAQRHLRWRIVHAGERIGRRADPADGADADIRVWHPSAPDFIRTRVRNDDSIVLELALGHVSLVLPGDIGSAVERELTPHAAALAQRVRASARSPTLMAAAYAPPPSAPLPLPLRVLKVPHHGSKTSSTAPFLDALQPRLAIVSAGRGNRHGHPAPAVLARYAARGTEVFRTDQDGAIQLDTDGHTLTVRTCSGRRLTLQAGGHD